MLSISVLLMGLTETFGQPLKVMFFGDSVISGLHDKDYEICPFRYEFLRQVDLLRHEVEVIGTNADPEGTCQKIGETLDVHNSGYQNTGTDGLLDYIMADLQYLHKPVDYIFTSLGAKDCMEFVPGRDYQIISQSIRRIMGRLLSINDKAKLVHVPILLPESAGKVAVKCMNVVNGKLREIYEDNLNTSSIAVVQLPEKIYGKESFYPIAEPEKKVVTPPTVAVPATVANPAVVTSPATSVEVVNPSVAPPATVEPQTPPAVVVAPPLVPAAPVVQPQTPTAAVTPPIVPATPVVQPQKLPAATVPPPVVAPALVSEPQATTPVVESPFVVQPGATVSPVNTQQNVGTNPGTPAVLNTVTEGNTPRRIAAAPIMFLPKEDLAKEIAGLLIKTVDWGFRAHTLLPTPKVTKEPDYYGYDWCTKNYEQSVCFEYYYGYVWCTENYGEEACYDYYYGEMGDWGPKENYKYCINWYDEEYCQFAYLDGKPETWDWLSFGYHDCLKNKTYQSCFDLYYGYAWCLSEKKDVDCYSKYYGADNWEWTPAASYKWCLNFHDAKNCSDTYLKVNATQGDHGGAYGSGNMVLALLVSFLVFAGCVWLTSKKLNCFGKKSYSKISARDEGGEDEVELL